MPRVSRRGVVRATPPHRQVPPAGEGAPVEVAAPWPFTAALLDLRARRRALALEDLRPVRSPAREMQVRATLLTLAPTFPTRSGPCDPAAKPGFLSWGCPKIAPPSCGSWSPRSRSRSAPASLRGWRLLRDGNADSHPACRPRGFSPPRRFLPPRPRGLVACRCRSWGSRRFPLSRNRVPRRAPAALRSLPSADSCGRRDESRPSAGPRHRADRLRSSRSPRTLPPRPFSLTGGAWRSPAASPRTRAGASRPCSIVGSVA
jgi:hypothetical protein